MSILRFDVIKQKDEKAFSPELLYLTRAKFENDLHSTLHFHSFAEIFLITNGHGEVICNNKSYRIKKGDICIINPNNIHTEISKKENAMEYLMVAVDKMLFDFSNKDSESPVFCFEKQYERLLFYFEKISSELNQKLDYYQNVVDSAITDILVIILRQIGATTKKIESPLISKECETVKTYIDSHYTMPLNLEKMAKLAFISEGHLIRSFNKYLGISPMAYLRKKRISEAKTILKTTDYAISDIGYNIGFSSPSHFIQIFSQFVGCTPNEYRQRCAENPEYDNNNPE